ncbi:MAG: hypothetical protein PHQ88_07920 [Bacteroides sp.]|nr:hypothetical protein [Syntrophomonadaceae bacterium]MDD4720767.1 hypothetical protein [Bacteroides sp.]
MLDEEGELFLDSIEQIDDPFSLYDLEKYSEELKVGNVRVDNEQMKVIKNSIKTAADFLTDKG